MSAFVEIGGEAMLMSNDTFVAFWVGCLAGLVIGIVVAAILAAIANSIEKGERSQ